MTKARISFSIALYIKALINAKAYHDVTVDLCEL